MILFRQKRISAALSSSGNVLCDSRSDELQVVFDHVDRLLISSAIVLIFVDSE